MLRVAAIEPRALTLTTASLSLRRFRQRPGEVLVLGQVLDTKVRVDDPRLPQLANVDVVITDLGIEQTRTRDGWWKRSLSASCDGWAGAASFTSWTGATCRA
jgi:hypothetical protein